MGLLCTRYSSPSGFIDRGNHSCAGDLAALARAVLREPRLARIVRRRQAVLPFPIKGRKLYLYNNNPLLRMGYRGTTGLKTGYTDAAGRCLVATARRGPLRLGVVLLHSPDPATQARKLLDRGFARAGGASGRSGYGGGVTARPHAARRARLPAPPRRRARRPGRARRADRARRARARRR